MSDSTDEVRASLSGSRTPPVSDPTALTTDALEREILHLRELIEARLDQMDTALVEARSTSEKAVEAARVSSQTAVEAAIDAAKTAIVEFDSSITRRLVAVQELSDSKFITYRTLLDSNAEKVALALASVDKAVDAAFASTKEATLKAELFNTKQFDNIIKQIDELKSYRDSTSGKGVGVQATWGYLVGAIGLAATIISIIIATRP